MEEMTIGKRIMALRKERGLTQEQLADKVAVSPQAVSKWENDISCPDISIVPQIASVLGVTTDELLGAKPIEPKVVVVNTNSAGAGCEEGNDRAKRDADRGGLYFALVIIFVGLVFLLSKMNVLPFADVNFWGIVWPAVLLGVGVSWTITHRSPLGFGVALLGLYYLLFNLGAVAFVLSWGYIWPILLILLGITIVLDHFYPSRWWKKGCEGPSKNVYSEMNGFVRCDSAFCEDNRVFAGGEFYGGDVDLSFGKGTLDLTKLTGVRENAELDIDVSFGEYNLILPHTLRLVMKNDKAFGSIQTSGSPLDDAPYALRVDADVSFGTLNIRYQ